MKLLELKSEIVAHKNYKDLADEQWDVKTTYRGLHKRSQKDFDWLEELYPKKISDLRDRLAGDWDFSVNISRDGKELNSQAEIYDAISASMDEWYYCQEKERRLLDKLACVIEEQRLRKDGIVVRTDTHEFADYYMSFTPTNAGTLTGTWTFTNGSNSITAAANGDAIVELDAGDYVRQSDGTAWYKVTATPDADTITIATNFQQATHTDDIGVSKNADVSSMDGLTIANAYVDFNKYTTVESRVPGDRLIVRANETHGTNGVGIVFDESGSSELYIEIIFAGKVGDGDEDPWGDDNATKAIIDIEDAPYRNVVSGDKYWKFTRLDTRRGSNSLGLWWVVNDFVWFQDCNFQDAVTPGFGVKVQSGSEVFFDNCTFLDLRSNALEVASGGVVVTNCTFTAGVGVSTDNGIKVSSGGVVIISDSIFSGSFDNSDILLSGANGRCISRNVTYSASGISVTFGGAVFYSEDDDGTYKSQITIFEHGTITRGTTSPRAGGADSFAIMESNSLCGPNRPLRLGDRLAGFARVWKTAGSYTATVYARVDSAWDSALTAAECYMVTSELDNIGDASHVERQSTETINNATSWTAFTTAVTPAREGWIYFWFYLAKFEDATEKVDVDIKVDVS